MTTRIRLARKGDGAEIARLAKVAVGGYQGGADPEAFGRGIDREGGMPAVPHGQAFAFVAVEDDEVVGLAYATPPVQMLQDYAEQMSEAVRSKVARMLYELELLAVDESAQGQGIGSTLLAETERILQARRCGAMVAKITGGGDRLARWYETRGYQVGEDGLPFVLQGPVPLLCGGEPGVRIAIKSLGEAVVRQQRLDGGNRKDGPYCNKIPYPSRNAAELALPVRERELGVKLWVERCRNKACYTYSFWHHRSSPPRRKVNSVRKNRRLVIDTWENEGGALGRGVLRGR